MNVFVVFHRDIEDSKWVRGVFSTLALAEACATSTEDRFGYTLDHFTQGGTVRSICDDIAEWVLDGPLVETS